MAQDDPFSLLHRLLKQWVQVPDDQWQQFRRIFRPQTYKAQAFLAMA